jgi:L-threonylcarbamoyladenylate synthase
VITKAAEIAKNHLDAGQCVAIPTETVYGLAANAFCESSVKKIFELKQRPHYNPLIVHVKSVDYIEQVACEIPPLAYQLIARFWPGSLTLVLKKQPHVPGVVTAGKDTVALRMPNHPVALELLSMLDYPLAAPSANPFGSISPTSALHVAEYFPDLVVLDGGQCINGIESTIVGFDGETPVLYRHGSIAVEEIEQVTGTLRQNIVNDHTPVAPGMLTRHYAPKTTTRVSDDLNRDLAATSALKVGILAFIKPQLPFVPAAIEILSETGDLKEAASNLYGALHRLDKMGLDLILAERLPDAHLGKSINDRLHRAQKK